MPFLLDLALIIALALYLVLPDKHLWIVDTLTYVSPLVVVGMLVQSKILKMCKWHKTACCLPLIPQVLQFIDDYIVTFSYGLATTVNISLLLVSILLLFSAYKVFIKPGRNNGH